MVAQTALFDPTVTSTSGDLWEGAVNPSARLTPVTIQPGATGVITVIITPSGASGLVVKGNLYVNDFAQRRIPPYGQAAGDELAASALRLHDQVTASRGEPARFPAGRPWDLRRLPAGPTAFTGRPRSPG